MPENYQLVSPPADIFKQTGFQTEPSKSVVVPMNTYIFEKMELPEKGGMLAYFRDCPFPAKGFPFPQAILACNGAKRFFKRGIDVIASKDMVLPFLGFLLSPQKTKTIEKMLDAYADGALYLLYPYLLDSERYAECPKEIRTFLETFLTGFGIDEQVAKKFAEVFAAMIQYDDAYRLRVEDIISTTTKERMLENPAKEINNLIQVLSEREPSENNIAKFRKIGIIIKALFLVPSFKKAFRAAIQESRFENFQLDSADRFHLLLRDDYNALGLTFKEREAIYIKWFEVMQLPFPIRVPVKLQ